MVKARPRTAEEEAFDLLKANNDRVGEVIAVQSDAILWLDTRRRPWTTSYFRADEGVILGERRKGFVA